MRHIFPHLFCLISLINSAGAHPDHAAHDTARQGCPVPAASAREHSCEEMIAPGIHDAPEDTVRFVLPDLAAQPDDAQALPLAAADIAEQVRIKVRHLSTGQDGNGAPGAGEDDTDGSASQEKEDEDPDALHESESDHKGSIAGSRPAA